MSKVLDHPDAELRVDELESGRRRLHLTSKRGLFVPVATWETSYPVDLIALILEKTGVWVLDEIMRDEDPRYVAHGMRWEVLSYLEEGALENVRILDFGSGSGASTMVLARLAPSARIVGVELDRDFVEIARARARFHGVDHRVDFLDSMDPTGLPEGLGTFDYIVMTGVFEHLLPEERIRVMPQLWRCLKVEGMLFVNQTPHRWFPLEHHTTGLPLINYLPAALAGPMARRLSSRMRPSDTWPTLLRKGIRGGTHGMVMGAIKPRPGTATLMMPVRFGLRDQFDLWYEFSNSLQPSVMRRYAKWVFRSLHRVFGFTLVPYIAMAIRKTA